MPKITTGLQSSALNADIIALFDEEDLDPIRELIILAKHGHRQVDESGIEKFVPLAPMERFKVLKDLAEYAAPKLKAVDISERKKTKTIVKVVQHGDRLTASQTQSLENTSRDLTKPVLNDGTLVRDAVKDAMNIPVRVKQAVQVDAYGGFQKVRTVDVTGTEGPDGGD